MKTETTQVIILCGGLGTRLGERARHTPKALISVAGKPYLEWQIEMLKQHGFRRFLFLTGHFAEQIEAHFQNGRQWGVQIDYSRESRPLGTALALQTALPKIEERFLSMNGDTFFPVDYPAFLAEARTDADACWIVVVPREALEADAPRANVGLQEDHSQVVEYVRGGSEGLSFVHAGLLLARRDLLEQVHTHEGTAIEPTLFPQLITERRLRAFVTRERFYDMGTPEQLRALDAAIRARMGHSQ